MSRFLYLKLAVQNVFKEKNTFYPFVICTSAMVMMFYLISNIEIVCKKYEFEGNDSMALILHFGIIVCGIVSAIMIFYTNNFVMKRRVKQLGLYSMLGMEKKHIGRIVIWETFTTGFVSIISGLLLGTVFTKMIFLLFLKIVRVNIDIKFELYPKSIISTVIMFTVAFAAIIFINIIKVVRFKPIQLINNSKAGEKEPKSKLIITILGCICLGIGYYIAVTVQSPLNAIFEFFIAVVFVIIGTYLLFISGSITFIKLLKSNKGIYYNKNNYVTISGMLYRMKMNATGLASICVLSTAVLVTLGSTVSLFVGCEDNIRNMYPTDISTYFLYDKELDEKDGIEITKEAYDYSLLTPAVEKKADEYNVKVKDLREFYLLFELGKCDGKSFEVDRTMLGTTMLYLVTVDDFNRITGSDYKLNKDEVLVELKDQTIDINSFTVFGKEYSVKQCMNDSGFIYDETMSIGDVYLVVVNDFNELLNANNNSLMQMRETDDINEWYNNVQYQYVFNLEGKTDDKKAFAKVLRDTLNDTGVAHLAAVENIYDARDMYISFYGSLFFLGIFVGLLFTIITVMIIYYKQISEGYDDKSKFEILKKVGMSEREVKQTIRKQIITVFMLPIAVAIVHICFAFNIVKKILVLLGCTNTPLLIACFAATIALYTIAYAIVYLVTAKSYYKIVYAN